MKKSYLTPKQQHFVELYFRCGNMAQAYTDAGYVSKDRNQSYSRASALIRKPEVQAYLNELKQSSLDRSSISIAKIINSLQSIAFGDLSEVVQKNGSDLELRDDMDMSNIDSLSFSKSDGSSDVGTSSARSFSFKRSDRLKALDMLCKIGGLYAEDTDDSGGARHTARALVNAVKLLNGSGGK